MNAASAPADPLHGVHRNRGMWSFRTDKVNISITRFFSLLLGDKIISSWKKLGLKRSTHHWFWDSMVLHHLLSSSRWCWMLMMVVLCFCLFFGKASLYISLKISLNGMKIVCIFFPYEQNIFSNVWWSGCRSFLTCIFLINELSNSKAKYYDLIFTD